MLGRTYAEENCSIARALEAVGERWSLLIMRDAVFGGSSRFTEFQRSLGIAPNVLASRLAGFVDGGLMELRPLAGDQSVSEYVLTDKGLDLRPALMALTAWGDRWAAPQGPPIGYRHEGCGGAVRQRLSCEECGADLCGDEVTVAPGPGAKRDATQRTPSQPPGA